MKKNYLFISLLAMVIIFSGIALAVDDNPPPVSSFDDIVGLFEKAATWMYRIFFIIAVMYLLLAAFTYLRAGEDATQVQKATGMIKYAVIAIVVALVSTGASLIIKSFITQ